MTLHHGEFDDDAAAAAADAEDVSAHYKLTGETTVLKEQEKMKAEDGPSRVLLEDLGPGLLVIRWDNTHSIFRNKRLHFAVDVHVGEGDVAATAAGGGGGGGSAAAAAAPALPEAATE